MPIPASLLEGLQLPVIAAPMFLVSGTRLVIEACKNGIIGSLPSLNARPSAQLDDWLYEIEAALAKLERPAKFGVMLAIHKSNARLDKVACRLVAQSGHDGMARALLPAHTDADGDALIVVATGAVDADFFHIRLLAQQAVTLAIRSVGPSQTHR